MERIGIIGGGAWGTALAQTLARAGRIVMLWAHEPETVAGINEAHENALFLPGVRSIRRCARPPTWRRRRRATRSCLRCRRSICAAWRRG